MFSNERGHIHLISLAFVIVLVLMFLPYITGERGMRLFEWSPQPDGLQSLFSREALQNEAWPEDVLKLANGSVQARYRLLKFQTALAKSAWNELDPGTRQKILSGIPSKLQDNKRLFELMMEEPAKFNIENYEYLMKNIERITDGGNYAEF